MIEVKFITWDEETDGIAVEHNGQQVWQDMAHDSWDQYFRHYMPKGVPVTLAQDTRPSEHEDAEPADNSFEDDRDCPDGNGSDARLKRWLVNNSTDPRIREQGIEGLTLTGGEVYDLLFDVADRFYSYGTDDVHEHYGIRR